MRGIGGSSARKPEVLLRCSKCGAEKPSSEFHRNKNNPSGFHFRCKACRREDNQAEKRIRRYHVSPSDHGSMLEDQGGLCAICSGEFDGRGPSVDHDHNCCSTRPTCGACTRGLLCNRCNVKLGVLENLGIEWARSAMDYIMVSRARI